MPVRRSLLALVAAVAVVASGLTAGGAASASPGVSPGPGGYTPAPVTWSPCTDKQLPPGLECGTVVVPLDWNAPGGTKIRLAVSRAKHTAKPYQGVLLLNPGGPGGSGTFLPVLKGAVPNGAGDGYDWIGFDPRGVGASTPKLSCIRDYSNGPRPAYVPTSRSIERAWIARSKRYAAACAAKNGALLKQITTENTVKDMDAIRVALRQKQINYFGFSYGTALGQVYGTQFPTHLRRAIFDSNVDPRTDWYQSNLDQNIAFETVSRIWFSWIAKYNRIYHLGSTRAAVSKAYYAAQDKLGKHPVGHVGAAEWTDTMLVAGYVQFLWPQLAQAFSDWVVKHDKKALTKAYDSFGATPDDNTLAVYTATQCNETAWPASYSVWRADQSRVARVAPFETWGNAWFNAPCLYWPLPAGSRPRVDGRHVSSALLIDETLDAATPYSGSLEVRRRFPNAVLVAEPGGTSHANSLSGNLCVDTTIGRYLQSGTLPTRKAGTGADKYCKPLPQPTPKPTTHSGSGTGSSRGTVAIEPYLLRSGLR